MTTSPRKLNAFLCGTGIPHPNGTTRCERTPRKACKKGKRLRKGKCVRKKHKRKKHRRKRHA